MFPDEEYEKVGCELVDSGTWPQAPIDATILGLNGLTSTDHSPIKHQHLYFAYAYKQQSGWKEHLSRFIEGGGRLLDLEYLVDDHGRRLVTFTKMAGSIGMATAILVWCHQRLSQK